MMPSSQEMGSSANFIWDMNRELGKGATCVVYAGRNKETTQEVAVKVYSKDDRRPPALKYREFEVLKKLNHRNVVRLLTVELDKQTNREVMIMEYCDSGSLFSVLEDPANGNGLPESEFLRVVKHVADGMKHLRENNIIHRDIKPGNILRCLDQENRYVYKLTDFGAARELPDEEGFTSLCGTEEYLHPNIYQRALINNEGTRQFSAEVDLWSIGVTYFQTATGFLPFRSYLGRGDRQSMFMITSRKKPGVISGVQAKEKGAIQWSRELPATCELSLGLKPLLTKLLAGLMETNPDLVWPFDKFFSEVEVLTSRVRVDIFCPSTASSFALALDPNDNMSRLREAIAMETDVKAGDQLLVLDGRKLTEWVQPLAPLSQYPPTSPTHPIFVLTRSHQEFATLCRSETGVFPQMKHEITRHIDYSQARRCCVVTHAHIRCISRLQTCSALLHTAVDYYCRELERRQQEVWAEWQQVSGSVAMVMQWLETFLAMLGQLQGLVASQALAPASTASSAGLHAFLQDAQRQAASTLKPAANALKAWLQNTRQEIQLCMKEELKASVLRARWNADPGPPPEDHSVGRAERCLERMKRTTAFFRDFRDLRKPLPFNEEQIYRTEKAQLIEMTTTIHTLHKDHCLKQARIYYGMFQSWLGGFWVSWKPCEKADLALGAVRDHQQQLSSSLAQMSRTFLEELSRHTATDRLQQETSTVSDGMRESYAVIEHGDVDSMVHPGSGLTNGVVASPSTPARPQSSSARPQLLLSLVDGLKDTRLSLEEVMSLVQENMSMMQKFSPPSECAVPWDHMP